MGFKFGARSKRRRKGVNDILIECSERGLGKSVHDMTIPWMAGLRSAEQQNEIFKRGNSKLDGYNRKSYHQTGNALDIVPLQGSYSNDKAFRHFAKCMFSAYQEMIEEGKVPKGLYLEWGGHWQNFIDKPHWQLVYRQEP